jgi:hypothetical protein
MAAALALFAVGRTPMTVVVASLSFQIVMALYLTALNKCLGSESAWPWLGPLGARAGSSRLWSRHHARATPRRQRHHGLHQHNIAPRYETTLDRMIQR